MKGLFFSLLISIVFYVSIFNGFFQQDEWNGFSEYILRTNISPVELLKYFFAPSVIHFTPLTLIVLYLMLTLFSMNYLSYAIVSLLLHLLAIVVIFMFFKNFFKSEKKAGIAILIFISFSSIFQATSWVMADVGTHIATIFGVLSTIYFLKFLRSGEARASTFSFLLLFVSLFFKEITIGLFFLFIFLVKGNKETHGKSKKLIAIKIILAGLMYLMLRTVMMFFAERVIGDSATVFEIQTFSRTIYNFLSIPIKAVSQSIIPIQIIRGASEFFATLFPLSIAGSPGSPSHDFFVVKRVMEAVSLALSLVFVLFTLIKSKKDTIVVFGILWVLINSFIYAFSPGRAGIISVIDSRNLYFVSIGSAMVLSYIYFQVLKINKLKSTFFLLLIILPNLYFLHINIQDFVKVSGLRKSILTRISVLSPDLPDKTVIYTESSQSYYGLPEQTKIMPFQSGFGQTLLTFYYPTEKFPRDFFKNRFLWEIDSQGYKEFEDRGFGYFRDLSLLKEAVSEYNLPKDSVISYSWDGKKNILLDISDEVRQEIYAR